MKSTDSEDSWGLGAQLLHWSIAVLVLGMIPLGWAMLYWPQGPTKFALFAWHKSLGILILTIVALRMLWRLGTKAPTLPGSMPPWERAAAHAAHAALYAIVLGMSLSGYVINSAVNFPLAVFGLFTVPNVTAESELLQHGAETTHLILFWVLAVVLVGHIGGALRHHFLLRDGILWRMLPHRKRRA